MPQEKVRFDTHRIIIAMPKDAAPVYLEAHNVWNDDEKTVHQEVTLIGISDQMLLALSDAIRKRRKDLDMVMSPYSTPETYEFTRS